MKIILIPTGCWSVYAWKLCVWMVQSVWFASVGRHKWDFIHASTVRHIICIECLLHQERRATIPFWLRRILFSSFGSVLFVGAYSSGKVIYC